MRNYSLLLLLFHWAMSTLTRRELHHSVNADEGNPIIWDTVHKKEGAWGGDKTISTRTNYFSFTAPRNEIYMGDIWVRHMKQGFVLLWCREIVMEFLLAY